MHRYFVQTQKIPLRGLHRVFTQIWDTPTSKVGNTMFDVYLFENRKLRRSEMSEIACCGIRNWTIWCFCNRTSNCHFLFCYITSWFLYPIIAQGRIMDFRCGKMRHGVDRLGKCSENDQALLCLFIWI